MYHIKKDKRMITSARMISEAFDECLEKKPFEKITVTEILLKAKVGRSTFYRLFDSIVDILAYKCDKSFEEVIDRINGEIEKKLPIRDTLIKYTEYWINHYRDAEKIIESGHIEIIFHSNNRYIKEIINMFYKINSYTDRQCEYIASILSAALITWIKTGKEDGPEKMVDDICHVITGLSDLIKADSREIIPV